MFLKLSADIVYLRDIIPKLILAAISIKNIY